MATVHGIHLWHDSEGEMQSYSPVEIFFFKVNLPISIMGVSIRFFIPLLSKETSNILWHQLYYSLKFSFYKLQLLQKNAKNIQRGGI